MIDHEELFNERWALREQLWGRTPSDPEELAEMQRMRARIIEINQLLGDTHEY